MDKKQLSIHRMEYNSEKKKEIKERREITVNQLKDMEES